MKYNMKIIIDIDPSVNEPEVIIRANEETSLVKEIVSFIQERTAGEQSTITVFRNGITKEISQSEIIRVYTEDRKMIVWTSGGEYQTSCTLRELEEIFDKYRFLRISRYEIINLLKVKKFDFSISGSLRIEMENGVETWASRRNISEIKKRLMRKDKDQ